MRQVGVGILVMLSAAGFTFVTTPDEAKEPGHLLRPKVPMAMLLNGGFELDHDQLPQGWQGRGMVWSVHDGVMGTKAVMLIGIPHNPYADLRQRVPIPRPIPSVVTVSGLAKGSRIESVDDDHEGIASVAVSFLDATGRPLGSPKKLTKWFGGFRWKPWSGMVRVPPKARQLEVALALDGAVGRVWFDEVELLWGFPEDRDRHNLLVDGGFEYPSPLSAWTLGKGYGVVFPGLSGRSALRIKQNEPASSVTSQEWVVDERQMPTTLRCSLSVKLERVRTEADSGGVMARLTLMDRLNRPLEEHHLFGPWTGSRDWSLASEEIAVPPETRRGTIRLIMHQATGTAWFDDVRLEGLAGDGPIGRPLESKTPTGGWKPFRPVNGPLAGPFDASDLLDPPAGRHGFLESQDGRFVFQDETPVRFFGVNIQGAQALPTHKEAKRLAQRLAQMGCNVVRLTHLDSPWEHPNLFDQAFEDTQHLSTESLDRLDHFIAQLKERGIYVYLDLLVKRTFKAKDLVPAYRRLGKDAKLVAQYSPRLIQLQKQFAHDLLTHYNPYTKTRLVDEPAIALIDLVNESSLFELPKRAEQLPPIYLRELRTLWGEFLAGHGVVQDERRWYQFLDGEDPLTQEFYRSLELRYFEELSGYLRGLGLRIPIAGSNLSSDGQDLATNAQLDFIDRHAYWDHPEGGFGDLVKVHNRSMVKEVEDHNPIVRLSRQRVAGKPFVVSEWNIPWPNEYRSAGPLLMAAYALFQDWDGLIQFNYQGTRSFKWIEGNFDVSTKPELFLQFPAAARLFHRGDVTPTRMGQANPIIPQSEIPWVSETGELHWDTERGLVFIETPRTQATIGHVGDLPVQLRDVGFVVTTPFACLSLTSLDDQPLEASRRLLLSTLARSENTDTRYNATRTLLRTSGTSPVVMEPVVGSAFLPLGQRDRPRVFALDAGGRRVAELRTRPSQGMIEIPLGQSPVYEIQFEDEPT